MPAVLPAPPNFITTKHAVVMNTFLPITLSLWFAVITGSARPQTNDYPADAAQSAGDFLRCVRSNVLDQVSQVAKNNSLGSKDLENISSALDVALHTIQDAHWDEKLISAANEIEMVRTQILAVASDPANKEAMALEADAPSWLRDIHLSLSSASILQTNIIRLRGTVEELRKCTLLLEPIEPPARLSEKLHRRLQEVLAEWEQETPTDDKRMAANSETGQGLSGPPQRFVAEASENIMSPYIPPGPQRVLEMAQAKVEDRAILQFIAASPGAFQLTADQILFLRQKGVSEKVIVAMLKARLPAALAGK